MAATRRRSRSLRAHLKPRHKLWLNWDGAFLMGPRYLRFLEAVDRTGTIRTAGPEVGWSYRTCLNRIREMKRVLGTKVLVTRRGGASRGGARLWSGTIGQFKTPFARQFILSSSVLELADRSLVVDALAPNRDIGAMAQWGQAGSVTIQSGVFNGEGINRARNADNRMLYVGRLVVTPIPGVAVGGAVAAASDSTRVNAEMSAQYRGWTLRAEYLQRHRDLPADEARGWYALATYVVRPHRLQLVGRMEQFDPSSTPNNRTTAHTVGFQYFFRGDDLKVLASYGAFVEQGAPLGNNRFIVQLQGRF